MSEQAPPLAHNKNHPLRDLPGALPAHHPSNLCLSCQPPRLSWSLGVVVSPLCLYASVFLSDSSVHTPGYSISLCLYPSVSILLLAHHLQSLLLVFLSFPSSLSHLAFPPPVLLLSLGAYLSQSFSSPHLFLSHPLLLPLLCFSLYLCLVSGVSPSPDSASVCLTISLSGSVSPVPFFLP